MTGGRLRAILHYQLQSQYGRTSHVMKRAYALLAIPFLALVPAACGGSGDSKDSGGAMGGHSMGASAAPAAGHNGAGHNDQDVMFAQMMIPHHQQAVDMAKLAANRASQPKVKQLAAAIQGAQGPEIQQMTGWLRGWGAAMPNGGMGTGHGADGMMSAAEMSHLGKLSGPAFDKAFLQMMIKHHQGAIVMATTEQHRGMSSQVKAMVTSIIRSQSAEITTMHKLLNQ
ncbi:MAG TPA: DUF305 domain-containing protein [Streptosporangiaceae bacterium]